MIRPNGAKAAGGASAGDGLQVMDVPAGIKNRRLAAAAMHGSHINEAKEADAARRPR
jgi:hypothetical protein